MKTPSLTAADLQTLVDAAHRSLATKHTFVPVASLAERERVGLAAARAQALLDPILATKVEIAS